MELAFIEGIEREVQVLYTMLEKYTDIEDQQVIMQAIQERNLMLSRLMPCE